MTRQQQQHCRYAVFILVIVLPHVSSWSTSSNNRNKWNLEVTLQKTRKTAQIWITTVSVGAALATSAVCPAGAYVDDTELVMPTPPTEAQSKVVPTKTIEDDPHAETQQLEQQVEPKASSVWLTVTSQADLQAQSDPIAKSQADETKSTEQEDWKPVFQSIDITKGSKTAKEEESSKFPVSSTEISQDQKQDGTESKARIHSTDSAQAKQDEKCLVDDHIETLKDEEKEESSTKPKIESTEKGKDEKVEEKASSNKTSEAATRGREDEEETRFDEQFREQKSILRSTETTNEVKKKDDLKESVDFTENAHASRMQVESRSTANEFERPKVEEQEESQAKVESSETAEVKRDNTKAKLTLTEKTEAQKQKEVLKSSIGPTRASQDGEQDKPSGSPPTRAEKSKTQVDTTEITKDKKSAKTLVCSIEANEVRCYFY